MLLNSKYTTTGFLICITISSALQIPHIHLFHKRQVKLPGPVDLNVSLGAGGLGVGINDSSTNVGTGSTPTVTAGSGTVSPSSKTTSTGKSTIISTTTAPSTSPVTSSSSSSSPTTIQISSTIITSNIISSTVSSSIPSTTEPTSTIDTSSSTIVEDNVITSSPTTTTLATQSQATIIYPTTDNSGSSVQKTSTTSPTSTSTSKPGLANGNLSESSTVSDASKKIIAGLVGGVGGTLLLGGIAYVIFRIYTSRKESRQQEETRRMASESGESIDSITAAKIAAAREKRGSGWGFSSLTNRFAEPLDRYKSPGSGNNNQFGGTKGPMTFVNTASNF